MSEAGPAQSATAPRRIRTPAEVIEFLEIRLICNSVNPRAETSISESRFAALKALSIYPYIFSWSRWKPMRATPRQIMVKAMRTSQWLNADS